MPKLKIGDEVQIIVCVDKQQTALRGKIKCFASKGKVAKLDINGRIVTAFTSQVTKVEK